MKKLLVLGLLACVGCTSQLGRFTVYGPDGIDLTNPKYRVDRSKPVTGVDPAEIYLVFPSNTPSYDQAVRNAMAQRKGCVGLADAVMTRKAFWLLFGYCNFEVTGYPIVKKEAK